MDVRDLRDLRDVEMSATPAVELEHIESSPLNVRWLVRLADGAQVECVLYRGNTLCVSSQVGCAVRCPFCASGSNGLGRSLALPELIGQLQAVQSLGHELVRVTISGVGEPLHNPEVVEQFIAYCHAHGLAPSLTTSGGPLPRLRQFLHAPHNGLTISVHAGTEETRARVVPKGPPLAQLFETLREELPRMTQRRKRKTALAYLLVEGLNDREEEIDAFVALAKPLGFRVHLYAYNPVPTSPFARLPEARYAQLYARMAASGMRVAMSSKARIEGNGGCGTLVALHKRSMRVAQRV